MYAYKHTAKAATYTINLLPVAGQYAGQTKTVVIKANGFGVVNFQVDVP